MIQYAGLLLIALKAGLGKTDSSCMYFQLRRFDNTGAKYKLEISGHLYIPANDNEDEFEGKYFNPIEYLATAMDAY